MEFSRASMRFTYKGHANFLRGSTKFKREGIRVHTAAAWIGAEKISRMTFSNSEVATLIQVAYRGYETRMWHKLQNLKHMVGVLHGSGKEYICVIRLHSANDDVAKVSCALETLTGAIFQRSSLIYYVKWQLRIKTIYESKLLEFDKDMHLVVFWISCEAGTYVRTFCVHMGLLPSMGGHMHELQRVGSGMCEKLLIFDGEIGAASKFQRVTELLEGIHLVVVMEAISLGIKAGLHPWIIYDIISNAAGNSWVFKNLIPEFLKDNLTKQEFLDYSIQKLGNVLNVAKTNTFSLPLLSVAHQQLILATSLGLRNNREHNILKIGGMAYGMDIACAANAEMYHPEQLAQQVISSAKTVNRIGFIGLGAMSYGRATNLLKFNFIVTGYDVFKPSLARFAEAGALVGNFSIEISKDVEVLVLMVTIESQVGSVLFGDSGAVSALANGMGLKLVDDPFPGGVKRAAERTLTIMASDNDESLKIAGSVLSTMSEKLYIIRGCCCRAGSGVKMVKWFTNWHC